MRKILFATVVVLSITLVSCTSDAAETNSNKSKVSNSHNELFQTQKKADSTGGQGGTIPPPKP